MSIVNSNVSRVTVFCVMIVMAACSGQSFSGQGNSQAQSGPNAALNSKAQVVASSPVASPGTVAASPLVGSIGIDRTYSALGLACVQLLMTHAIANNVTPNMTTAKLQLVSDNTCLLIADDVGSNGMSGTIADCPCTCTDFPRDSDGVGVDSTQSSDVTQ